MIEWKAPERSMTMILTFCSTEISWPFSFTSKITQHGQQQSQQEEQQQEEEEAEGEGSERRARERWR